jgi:Trp operon repressor
MKVIISMLLEKDVTQDEITTILQLLINYAMTKEGAIHMSKIQILESLFKANIMQRLNEQDLYVSKQLKNQ